MVLGYRTVLTARATTENRDRILEILREWAVKKKRFSSLPTSGSVEHKSGAKLTASSYKNETSAGFRWELTEEWNAPKRQNVVSTTRKAVLQLTLVFTGEKIWLWVDVDAPTLTVKRFDGSLRQELHEPGIPAFVTLLLNEVEMFDGIAAPLPGFQIVPSVSDIKEIVAVLEDDSRVGAVFLTAPPMGTSLDDWRIKSDRRSYAMQGLAVGYVLAPEVLSEYNKRVSYGHTIPSGAMRTFLPGARLIDPEDAFNHKLMHPGTLRDSDERRVQRILRRAQIQRLAGIRLPDEMRDADYEFLRLRRLQPFEVLHQQPSSTDASGFAAENADLRRRLADAEELANEAMDDLIRITAERDDARLEMDLGRLDAESLYIQYSAANRDLEKIERQARYLSRQLIELGADVSSQSESDEEPEVEYPKTFEELVERIRSVEGVKFTGDKAVAAELDEHTALGEAVLTKTWDALLTFSAYSKARKRGEFDHSLSNYVSHPKHGHLVRIGKVIWSEGETVRDSKKMSRQRTFPVDKRVNEVGELMMVAHVKLSNLTGVAPRLYFHDTYSDVGYVTVGYLGAHLDNTQTN